MAVNKQKGGSIKIIAVVAVQDTHAFVPDTNHYTPFGGSGPGV